MRKILFLNLQTLYESMKFRVENVVERGKVEEEYIDSEEMRCAFATWTKEFTRHDHPTIIQVFYLLHHN